MVIDAHQHFWHYQPQRDGWITEEMSVIQRNFLPQDLEPLLREQGIDGCVAVQADQSEEETFFLLGLSEQHSFIKGVVGWVDLRDERIEEKLELFRQHPIIKGFRHILQGEAQRDLLLQPSFLRGIKALVEADLSYDILILPDQLPYASAMVQLYPGGRFVLDHLAKPFIRKQETGQWLSALQELAQHQNTYCKLSGLVTEAHWNHWKREDFLPYLDAAVEAFGPQRLMFGSDWPVCLLSASYDETLGIIKDYFSSFTATEQQRIFGGTATEFYRLK